MKIVKEALFNFKQILLSILFVSSMMAQFPNYDLDDWVGSNFKERVHPFFRLISLQTATGIISSYPDAGILLGISTSLGSHPNDPDVTKRVGMFPMITGSLEAGANLHLMGSLTGFSSNKDITFYSSLGLDFHINNAAENKGNWHFLFDRGSLEGPDDFFLKTVGAELVRGINYHDQKWWYGMGTRFYDAGVHVKPSVNEIAYRRRLKGKTQYIIVGMRKSIWGDYFYGIEGRIHSAVFVVSFSLTMPIK